VFALLRAGMVSPRIGIASLLMGIASPLMGIASPLMGLALVAAVPARAEEAAEAPARPELATPPRLRQDVPPDLPPGTVFPAPEVTVVLQIDVSADGSVERVALLEGAGEPFDGAAMAAAQRYVFDPARLTTGAPVPVTITYRLKITPPAPAPAPPPVRFSGLLLERGTRQPLAGVPVAAQAGEKALASTTSGPDGRFSLEVPASEFAIVVAAPDHQRLEARVEAKPGEEREETFYVEGVPSAYVAVVRGERVRREITKQVIPAEEVAQVAGTQGDTLKAVLNMPGAARASFESGALVLRGSSPQDSAAFVEGIQIPLVYHFGGLRSTFAPRFLDSIEFVPGNFGADYGRLTGGVVNVRVRDPDSRMIRGEADFNLYDAGVALEGPVSKHWSIGGAFRRSWIDVVLPLFIPSDSSVSFSTLPRFYDYQFLATWKPDEKDKVRILFFGSQDKLVAFLKRPASDPSITGDLYARIAYHELQATYSHVFSPTFRQESWVALGLQDTDFNVGAGLFFKLGLKRIDARSAWTWQALPGVEARVGLDLQDAFFDLSADVPQPPKEGEPATPISTRRRLGASETGNSFAPAAFAELRLTPREGLDILPALRVDRESAIARWSLDPRIAVRWSAASHTILKGAVGVYQQRPSADESDKNFGTPDLLFNRSLQYSVGIEQRIVLGVDLDVTGFYKDLDRRVVRNAAANVNPAAPRYTNEGTGRIYGVEALLRARFGERFFGWIAYTFQRSFRTDGPGEPERLFSFDQPHILTVLGTYKPNARWAYSARFRLVSGNPYTPATGSVYDAPADVYVPIYAAVNSARLGTFNALDLRVDRVWTFDRWRLSLYLDVQNVTNRENQEGVQYNFDYSQHTPLTGLPILPILGLKGEW
jgi:TonB family protein